MRRLAHFLTHGCIVLFCLWHMAAMGAYAVPDPAEDPVSMWIRERVQPWVRPYAYALSQWQQWNLFSPDPMRRETEYVIQAVTATGSERPRTITDLGPRMLPWWRSNDEMTSIRKIEDYENSAVFLEHYLSSYCHLLARAPRLKRLQLRGRMQVLPRVTPFQRQDWWTDWKPEWESWTAASIDCSQYSPHAIPFR